MVAIFFLCERKRSGYGRQQPFRFPSLMTCHVFFLESSILRLRDDGGFSQNSQPLSYFRHTSVLPYPASLGDRIASHTRSSFPMSFPRGRGLTGPKPPNGKNTLQCIVGQDNDGGDIVAAVAGVIPPTSWTVLFSLATMSSLGHCFFLFLCPSQQPRFACQRKIRRPWQTPATVGEVGTWSVFVIRPLFSPLFSPLEDACWPVRTMHTVRRCHGLMCFAVCVWQPCVSSNLCSTLSSL